MKRERKGPERGELFSALLFQDFRFWSFYSSLKLFSLWRLMSDDSLWLLPRLIFKKREIRSLTKRPLLLYIIRKESRKKTTRGKSAPIGATRQPSGKALQPPGLGIWSYNRVVYSCASIYLEIWIADYVKESKAYFTSSIPVIAPILFIRFDS